MVLSARTLTVNAAESGEKTWVSVVHAALAMTTQVPGPKKVWEALVVPTGSQPEMEPSPQISR
jgi:hypothetical protein